MKNLLNQKGVKALSKMAQKEIFGGRTNNGMVCCEWSEGSGSVVGPSHVCIDWVSWESWEENGCPFTP